MNIQKVIEKKLSDFICSDKIVPRLQQHLIPYFLVNMQKNNLAMAANIDYLRNKKAENKKVVYTCIVGKYDVLPLHLYLADDYDYVCFTDNEDLLKNGGGYGAWDIKPLAFSALDGTRNNRWHKLHPHILFPGYSESIYIDSTIQILDSFVFEQIIRKNMDIVIPKHNSTDCVYEEIERVLSLVVSKGRESRDNVLKMNDFLIEQNMPHHYGQTENNFIYRRHNNSDVIKMMEEWWYFVENYTKRDQLSSSYILWKHGILPKTIEIPNMREIPEHITCSPHLPVALRGI